MLAALQLVLAGFALLLAAQQASVWRWEGPRSPARLIVFTALAAAAVLVTNDLVIRALAKPVTPDWLLFARSVALAVLAVSTLPLAGSIAGRPPPRWLTSAIVVVAGTRLVLWPGTDLMFRHRLADGMPDYGPLMGPTGFVVIALVFGYLCVSSGRGRSDRERSVLVVGFVLSLVLAVVTVVSGSAVAAEVLSGYVPLPALISIAAILWGRQMNAYRTVRRLADDRQRANDELKRRAATDELTGLANRSRLRELVNQAIADGARHPATLAVALCDVDRFRAINDVHGHPAGDEVLEELARRLVGLARGCDVVGRFGGDEFVVLCTDADGEDSVAELGQRLTAAFEQAFVTTRVSAAVTASVGIVTTTADGCSQADADTMFRDADTAMYDAKARGGALIGQFHDGLRSAVVYRADLERRLVGAVERGEILTHFQPILSLPDRRIVGFEALARWQQGSATLSPNEWIPIAESTGLINEIGEHVLRQAVQQLQRWLADGHQVTLSVNVSPRQLSSRRFADAVLGCLATGVPPGLIALEVTESLAVDEAASAILAGLRAEGVRIALDDFGTGYSALGAVSRLPVDVLKVDQSIVRRANDPQGRALLTSVLAIARSLGLTTVAEGVETPELEAALAELGCELVQGFLYSPAVDAETAAAMLV
ncbi:hypothetical protein GCM10023145_35950 [Angustibacter luteus]|uniref:Bifunctional diguanylate cyclase/phosphodiesterase n=1 Tax=Angustibacter luteus TaxID=658456 RepID=A0ABW1JCV7_9ACTN